MQMLIKDQRGLPSFTETITAVTFILLVVAMVLVLFKILTPSYILWFLMPFGVAMSFRFNKKIRLGKSGIDISQDVQEVNISTVTTIETSKPSEPVVPENKE